jgi:outer membrane assembly lipoprotein YfiO
VTLGRLIGLVGLAVLAGCWPFKGGKPKAAATPAPVLANSPRTIDSLWRVGERAFDHGRWKAARELFTRLSTAMQANDPRLTRLHFYQGEIELADGNELDAVRQFRRIADETPDDSLAPDALLRAGDAYTQLWKRPELDPTYGTTAISVYQEVMSRYPTTIAAKRAEAKLKDLNDRFAYKEYQGALFYFKFKAYDSAILVLRSLIAQYPKAPIVPDALEKLVLSYRVLGYKEDINETCDYIARFFPEREGLKELCPAAATDSAAQR